MALALFKYAKLVNSRSLLFTLQISAAPALGAQNRGIAYPKNCLRLCSVCYFDQCSLVELTFIIFEFSFFLFQDSPQDGWDWQKAHDNPGR